MGGNRTSSVHVVFSTLGVEGHARATQQQDIFFEFCLNFLGHCDQEKHEADLEKLEKGFHTANDESLDSANIFLALRPKALFNNNRGRSLWAGEDPQVADADAQKFKTTYAADAQFVFSRCQHHWHAKNAQGERVPLSYCRPKGKVKKLHICKQNFPRHVLCKSRQKTRLVCRGIAAELQLQTSGRRNMLGSIAPERGDPYFAGTPKILAVVTRSNTNLQCPYRLPINRVTHDPDCKRPQCLTSTSTKQLCRISQKAMKQMSGYFGGYISKQQKIGQYELKKSIQALPLLQEKLKTRKLSGASHQLAHVVNRMFTTLESKGILRTGTEEFALASGHHSTDKLAAEFIRTFREESFPGRLFLERVESLSTHASQVTVHTLLPSAHHASPALDVVSLYGFRPRFPSLWYLSPFEFVQWCFCHKLRAPGRGYALTTLTQAGRDKRADGNVLLVAGTDFIANETVIGSRGYVHIPYQPSGTQSQILSFKDTVITNLSDGAVAFSRECHVQFLLSMRESSVFAGRISFPEKICPNWLLVGCS